MCVSVSVIKNPEFPEVQTVNILVALIQNRPKFETLNTWVGVNQSIPSLLSVSPPLSGCLGKVQKVFLSVYRGPD